MVKVLVKAGSKGGPGEDGMSLLDSIFSGKTVDFVMALLALKSGENIDGGGDGKTNSLLHRAAQKGFMEQINFLLENGADPNLRGRQDVS